MGVSCFFRKVQPPFFDDWFRSPQRDDSRCVFCIFLQEVDANNCRLNGRVFQTRTIRSLELDQSGPGKDLKDPKLAAEVQRARY